MNFKEELITLSAMVDDYLLKHFDNLSDNVSEKKLIEAMRYSIMGGGKRIRPVLTLAIAKMMSKDVSEVMPFAAAIEMIHTYSLIHDDLPAMDNDDYRRGKLTNHKVFGVAMAILAGDALLNEAFELLLKSATQSAENAKQFAEASLFVATAAGKQGMIAGQVIDMESEGKQTTETTLKDMHKKKTGALIKASILAPAICLGASSEHIKALNNYSENIGVAFQIKDDILDVESTTEELGKAIGSDAKNKKTTYVSLYGLEGAKTMLNEVTQRAINDIDIFGERAWFLKEIAYYIANRTH
jgi:geranylgeranyl diphosphate synthase type II